MSGKNISKFALFVIIVLTGAMFITNCNRVSSNNSIENKKTSADPSPSEISSKYENPRIIGTIKSEEITESSGIAQSRCNKNVLWTHNDSGDGAYIFALDLTGKKLGTWKITNAKNTDWEDIAAYKNDSGECFVYIADTGNNSRLRSETTIYKIKEPTVSGETNSNVKNPLTTEAVGVFKIKYEEGNRDAETLTVNPQTGDLYILTKNLDSPSGVYKLSADSAPNSVNTLKKIADIKVPAFPSGFVTGGDISPDGKRAVICDYFAAYELTLPDADKNFDDIWKQPLEKIDLGERRQGEACGYSTDGNSIFATSEKADSPLIKVVRK